MTLILRYLLTPSVRGFVSRTSIGFNMDRPRMKAYPLPDQAWRATGATHTHRWF